MKIELGHLWTDSQGHVHWTFTDDSGTYDLDITIAVRVGLIVLPDPA